MQYTILCSSIVWLIPQIDLAVSIRSTLFVFRGLISVVTASPPVAFVQEPIVHSIDLHSTDPVSDLIHCPHPSKLSISRTAYSYCRSTKNEIHIHRPPRTQGSVVDHAISTLHQSRAMARPCQDCTTIQASIIAQASENHNHQSYQLLKSSC